MHQRKKEKGIVSLKWQQRLSASTHLEKANPLDTSFIEPRLGDPTRVEQFVDVAVTMRFGNYSLGFIIYKNLGIVIQKSRNSRTLLDNGDLRFVHAKIFVFFQQLDRSLSRIIGDHNTKLKLLLGTSILLLNG